MEPKRQGSPKKRQARHVPDAGSTAGTPSRLDMVSEALFAPFRHRKTDSSKIFSDRKENPVLPPIQF